MDKAFFQYNRRRVTMKCQRNKSCDRYDKTKKLCKDNNLAYMNCGIWAVVDMELSK